MQIKEIMSRPARTVQQDTSLEEVARIMLDNCIGCVPVLDDMGKLVGIITESDFAAKERGLPFSTFHAPQVLGEWLPDQGVERIYDAARNRRAEEIMSCDVVTVLEDDSVEKAVKLMLDHDFNRLPVVRDDKPVGVVARHDLLRLMLR